MVVRANAPRHDCMAAREQEPSMACSEFCATSPSFGTSNLKGAAWAIGHGAVALVVPFLKQGLVRQRMVLVIG